MKTVGIIGGQGKMGRLIQKLFTPYVKEILISDQGTELTNVDLVKKADVVILSVTFGENLGVLKEVGPFLREEQLLMDLASLKGKILKEMLKTKAHVIGTHPLFGPSIKSLRGQTFVVCPMRAGSWEKWLTEILEKEGVKISLLDPEKHDILMAYVQSLTHFTSLIFMDALLHEIDIEDAMDHSTPVFQLLVSVGARVLSQSGHLYAGIQMHNEHFPAALRALRASFDHLEKIVQSGKKETFIDFYDQTAKKLGAFKEKGKEFSDAFLRSMKDGG